MSSEDCDQLGNARQPFVSHDVIEHRAERVLARDAQAEGVGRLQVIGGPLDVLV